MLLCGGFVGFLGVVEFVCLVGCGWEEILIVQSIGCWDSCCFGECVGFGKW